MGTGLFWLIILITVVFYCLTFISNNSIRQGVSFSLAFIFLISLGTYVGSTRKELPKYHINDKVLLPDDTWGNIDSVAYKVEGVWYNQEILKD